MKRSRTTMHPNDQSSQQVPSLQVPSAAAGTAVNITRALFEDGKHLKGINVIAPNLQVHVHVGQ